MAGQGCPACSNPAIQSSEKTEAGLDSLGKGDFRVTLNVITGLDYQGGHSNHTGLTPKKEVIDVPLHNHVVELDFSRMEFSFEYTFAVNWTGWLRVPYDIKHQVASIEYVEASSAFEKEAIIRNRDNHHRNETYKGFSDLRFLAARRLAKILTKNDRLDFAIGTSLPIGKTEYNPIKAGENGEKHLHIQFGTGTFDPLAELYYALSISNKTFFSVFTIGKLPFYENNKNYKGPVEFTGGISINHNLHFNYYRFYRNINLLANISSFYQSQALWDNEPDPNSGLLAYNGMIGLSVKLRNGLSVSPGYRYPIYQSTLSRNGDTFEFGPTFLLNVSRAF